MKDSQLALRKLAAALYGVAGVDATEQQVKNARKALGWYREGKSISYILLLLRIKRKPGAVQPEQAFEAIQLPPR